MASTAGLTGQAYQRVREALVGGNFAPGQALFESHLAVKLGMSRTPVREALRLLAREGYIETNPARGYLVPRLTLDDIREIFEIRESLESLASRSAAARATDAEIAELAELCDAYQAAQDLEQWAELGTRFHNTILAASRNRRLAATLDALKDQILVARRSSLHGAEQRHHDALLEHRAMLDAIRARDLDRAEHSARVHVRRSFEAILRTPDALALGTTNPI